ncbi:MAG: DUF2807 domain-containing protein [Bacteroidales bacterium]|nr:DUF2807 domain-containing protein [Bacteroidales bacterium]MCF8344856.1 DUF2807 domain-containing protein [Bacteroidales bacterium]MCF8374801.1 DUF2807 domain-containing protein [Bacteroidales bacterium]MCF8399795.1 DUF2807 domain-containing protein [Bacteroidales bacterium]
MKTILKYSIAALIALFTLVWSNLSYAQFGEKGDGNVIKTEIQIDNFEKIDVNGIINLYLMQGDEPSLFLETDENLFDNVKVEMLGDLLKIWSKNIRNYTELNLYLTCTQLESIDISGAAEIESKDRLILDELSINQSGASELSLEIVVEELKAKTSGASEMKLSGSAQHFYLQTSGASKADARNLEADYVTVDASGVSNAKVNANIKLNANSSGAADISSVKSEAENKVDVIVEEDQEIIWIDEEGERVQVKTMGVEVMTDNENTEVQVGNHKIIVDDWGNVTYNRKHKTKFNGHWAGVDLGVTGYLTPDNDMDFGEQYDYLDLNLAKSIKVGINFFELNASLSKNQKWGILTGMGYEFNNYRFDNNVMITPDSSRIAGFYSSGISMRKSKLVANYLQVPVLLEFQTNRHSNSNSFHLTAGAVFGLRVTSHTKRYFEEQNKNYELLDPVSREPVLYAESPNNSKVKEWDDFHLNPFRVDATIRIGWDWINLFGTYSLTTLFRENKGPELYPFTVGLTLAGW